MLKKFQTTSMSSTCAPEYSRILSAAVINSSFRSMLLSDPAKAIAGGYSGEKFNLGYADQERLSTIHASSLSDFASQLANI
jgi:hypothetical protein